MIQRLTRSTDDAGLTAAPMGEQELMMDTAEGERLRRWRLVLGEEAQASCGLAGLSPEDRQMDEALAALYEADSRHSLRGGSGASSPRVARWLGDIRRFFPSSVVQVMQKDAFERLNLHSMLLQPEMLESVQPDVNLVSTLMSLRGIIPEKTKETARLVVRKVVDALMKQLEEPMRTAVSGALNRAVRNRRPRHAEIDWNRTIRANLKHWQQEYKTIVPETLIGYGRKSQRVQREIILCIDQSGSMASSVVYSSIFGAVMASMPAVKTHLVVFDTAVVDMTEQLDDPVDLLFGVQLGGVLRHTGDQAADIRLLLGVGPVGVEVILCRQLGKAFIAELLVQKLLHRQFGEAQLVRQVYGDLPCGAACHKRSSFSLSSVVQLKLMPPTWTFTAATLKPVIPSSAVCTFFWTFWATSLMAQP